MTLAIEMKARPSIDPATSHLWVVYRELSNGKTEFIRHADDERHANRIIDENRNPASDYYSTLECYINDLDDTQEVKPEFLENALEDGLSVLEATESFFNDCTFDIDSLKPLKGEVDIFDKEVRKLNRPYIAISDEQYNTLLAAKADYYLTPTGKVVTFGGASTADSDCKYALMPLNNDEAHKVKIKNK